MTSKKYPVLDAQSAIHDFNNKIGGFKDIQSRIRPAADKMLAVNQNQDPTLDDMMRAEGVPTNFTSKSYLAKQFGMANYSGKPQEDKQIMQALQSLESRNQEQGKNQSDNASKEKDFGLKNRELDIKEKEIAAKQMPDADSIAQSLLSKFQQ